MSGGNHLRRMLATALLAASCLTAAPASAGNADGGTAIGIATANIAWAEPAATAATFESVRQAGFGAVRIGLKDPVARSYAALIAAKQAGLKVVVTFPLIDGAISEIGAAPRDRQGSFFTAHGLSQIDLDRFSQRLDALLDFAAQAQIPLIGLELGNELNWSGYNGDLPLAKVGKVIDESRDWPQATARRFALGLDRYRAVLELSRTALAARPVLADVKLVSAGLADINAPFIHESGATYVTPDLVYRAFAERGIFDLVDTIGIHLYEPLRNASNPADRHALIDAQLDDCGGAAFEQRPCWITEFGSALPQQTCAADDSQRIALMQPLLDRLGERGADVPLAFYYDWSEDKGFALLRCGHLTALTRLLSDQNNLNTAP